MSVTTDYWIKGRASEDIAWRIRTAFPPGTVHLKARATEHDPVRFTIGPFRAYDTIPEAIAEHLVNLWGRWLIADKKGRILRVVDDSVEKGPAHVWTRQDTCSHPGYHLVFDRWHCDVCDYEQPEPEPLAADQAQGQEPAPATPPQVGVDHQPPVGTVAVHIGLAAEAHASPEWARLKRELHGTLGVRIFDDGPDGFEVWGEPGRRVGEPRHVVIQARPTDKDSDRAEPLAVAHGIAGRLSRAHRNGELFLSVATSDGATKPYRIVLTDGRDWSEKERTVL